MFSDTNFLELNKRWKSFSEEVIAKHTSGEKKDLYYLRYLKMYKESYRRSEYKPELFWANYFLKQLGNGSKELNLKGLKGIKNPVTDIEKLIISNSKQQYHSPAFDKIVENDSFAKNLEDIDIVTDKNMMVKALLLIYQMYPHIENEKKNYNDKPLNISIKSEPTKELKRLIEDFFSDLSKITSTKDISKFLSEKELKEIYPEHKEGKDYPSIYSYLNSMSSESEMDFDLIREVTEKKTKASLIRLFYGDFEKIETPSMGILLKSPAETIISAVAYSIVKDGFIKFIKVLKEGILKEVRDKTKKELNENIEDREERFYHVKSYYNFRANLPMEEQITIDAQISEEIKTEIRNRLSKINRDDLVSFVPLFFNTYYDHPLYSFDKNKGFYWKGRIVNMTNYKIKANSGKLLDILGADKEDKLSVNYWRLFACGLVINEVWDDIKETCKYYTERKLVEQHEINSYKKYILGGNNE